jgi:hypothetical protein
MWLSEWVAPESHESSVPYVWSGNEYPMPQRPARPCIEHDEIACKKHMSSSYPETRKGLVGYRLWAGVITVVPVFCIVAAMGMAVTSFGVWVLYAPIVAFFALVALYGIGWGSTACYRLAKK